jgi:transaldolase
MTALQDITIKIFADGADQAGILSWYRNPLIRGFTTNPTLMHAAGLRDYEVFARQVIELVPDRPISFEVFSDDFDDMERQALKISAWGEHVYVKIPVTNCKGESSVPLLRQLSGIGIKVNVTAVMTLGQVTAISQALTDSNSAYVSVFAGRIADTGRDPIPVMRQALELLSAYPQLELIWASPREILNLFQANDIGCHIITMTHDLLRKLTYVGRDLQQFSLETVQMFFDDAAKAGFTL